MTDEPEVVRTSLRLPRSLYEKLQEASVGKTMHAEIIARLEASFETKDGTSYAHSHVNKIVDATIKALERNGWRPPTSD